MHLTKYFIILKQPLVLNRAFFFFTYSFVIHKTNTEQRQMKKEHTTSKILKLRNILVEVQSLWVWESSPLLNFFPRNYLLHSYFHFLSIYRVLKNKTRIAKLHFSGSNYEKIKSLTTYPRTQWWFSTMSSLSCCIWCIRIFSASLEKWNLKNSW